MEKMRLALSELAVETFATGETEEARGTVAANEATVTCIPRCGTVAVDETCYSGCTADNCG